MNLPSVRLLGLRVGRRRDVSVAAEARPPVSWTVEAPAGWRAAGAELRLDDAEPVAVPAHGVLVPWPFADLTAGARHALRARVRGADGGWMPWSRPVEVEAAFFPGPWTAALLTIDAPDREAAPFAVRREIAVADTVIGARLWATAHGVFDAAIDGIPVDDALLAPGWTAYRDRLGLATTDVTPLLRPGATQVLSARVAGGWFTERYGFGATAARFYGDQAAVGAVLRLTHRDGRIDEIGPDDGWRLSRRTEIVSSGLYAGERVDFDRAQSGWREPGFDASGWETPARVPPIAAPAVIDVEPVRRVRTIRGARVLTASTGDTLLLDVGENIVGRVRFDADGPAGTRVVVRHAEVLEDGALNVRPLRAAASVDEFVLDGAGRRVCEPAFTFHGFRYVEITGGAVDPASVEIDVLRTDLRRTGWFSCSDDRLNDLHANLVRSFEGNALSLPTDCPQRDERLGWTGDAQVFAATATTLFDAGAFYASWLRDLRAEQEARAGRVPTVVPDPLPAVGDVMAAGWGDAVTIVPAVLAARYGDDAIVAETLPAMRAWVDAVAAAAGPGRLWETGFQYGDWLDPTVSRPDKAKADPGLVATAYFFRSAELVARAGGGEAYARLAEEVRTAFCDAYLTPAGRLASDAPTAYALALAFGLVPAARRQAAADRLAFLLRAGGYRMATGFLGTPVVLDALLENGHAAAAESLLLQTMCPSWLYPLSMGATTMWERWDAVRPDGTLHPSGMTSLNHYALGAVGDVLHRRVAGLGIEGARVHVRPWFVEALTWAEATHDTPYGRSHVRWQRAGEAIAVTATVPHGTLARVDLGDRAVFEVASGRHRWMVDAPPAPVRASVGVESDLAVIADTPGACAVVSAALAAHDGDMQVEFDAYIRWVPGRRLRAELAAVAAPPAVVAAVDAALRDLDR
ncbi:alpha-L-rhamnosidase [Microbacterium sp. ru370.1]|uniref:alpha-L-rhamnosidase n=1 Tax=unclassified Microbacterium TaxID=2609290 RepID=UPI0008822D88|nr:MULTISPECIES: alpha-L-rhamnosidase [unclassified Microbacterium]SDO42673.1 alpha-L-rhamnosidase [Microbacterium sp. ru370.1]SIT80342.1 alpha-L-rhamnosidase [Microbacterium sp. RU1D]